MRTILFLSKKLLEQKQKPQVERKSINCIAFLMNTFPLHQGFTLPNDLVSKSLEKLLIHVWQLRHMWWWHLFIKERLIVVWFWGPHYAWVSFHSANICINKKNCILSTRGMVKNIQLVGSMKFPILYRNEMEVHKKLAKTYW